MYPFRNKLFSRRRGFTLLEVTVATLILAILATTVLVILDRCIDATMDLELRMRAFSVARENMERLLGGSSVTETTEFGIDELNPAIEWETIVEPFYEPITNRMWIQAVCSAGYTDSKNEMQTVQLTHWITSLTDKQIKQIEDQRQKEQEYLDLLNENDEYLQWQQVIREYFRDIGLDIEGYDQLLLQQKRQREQWIREYEYDPDLYDQLMDQMRQDEDDWLVSHGFDQQDFSQWTQENEELVAEIFSKKPSSYAAVSFPGGPFSPSSSNTGPTDSSAISGNNPSDTNSTNQSRLTPELRQLLKDTFGWTDEFIDQAFGGN